MQRLSQQEYESLARDARTLTADVHGPKVLLTPDGRIIKMFRRKRALSSALWNPYAARFARASRELSKRGIPAVMTDLVARVPHLSRDITVYRRLDGTLLRDAIAAAADPQRDRLVDLLASTLAMLHARGVYFRAAHFGNFLVQGSAADGEMRLALIDVSEARFRRGPLSASMRARNFRPLTSYAEDRAAIQAFGVERFVQAYAQAASFSRREAEQFRAALRRVHQMFTLADHDG